MSVSLTNWNHHLSPVDDDLHNIFFVNHSHGWIVTHSAGTVLHTTNGGNSWEVQARFQPGYLESLYFVDANYGWICGEEGKIYRTENGGNDWHNVLSGEPDWALQGIYFFNKREGFVIGTDFSGQPPRPVLAKTFDGGKTWDIFRETIPGIGYADAIQFISDREGFVGGIRHILHTEDRGESWQTIELPVPSFIRSLFFWDSEIGWAVGHKGLVLQTEDGGKTWKQLPNFTNSLLRSVAFTELLHGFIVGDRNEDDGVLYETFDGGKTWEKIDFELPDLHHIFLHNRKIWVVGKQGIVISRNY